MILAVLGVTAEASYDEIRKGCVLANDQILVTWEPNRSLPPCRFRKEALKWHPDKNAGSEVASKRFVKIQAAYEVSVCPKLWGIPHLRWCPQFV